jgi:hypothetical protein
VNPFLRLWYQWLTGCTTRRKFDQFLEMLGRRIFQGLTMSTLEHEIWNNLDVQQYYNYEQRHQWRAVATQGAGQFELGFLPRGKALQELTKAIAKSSVIHIDRLNFYVFYKLSE